MYLKTNKNMCVLLYSNINKSERKDFQGNQETVILTLQPNMVSV